MFRFKSWLTLVLLMPLGAAASLIVAEAGAEPRWRQYGGPDSRFQVDSPSTQAKYQPSLKWKVTLGAGMSQSVANESTVFGFYLEPVRSQDEGTQEHIESIVALNRETGKSRWKYSYDAGRHDEQQAFGGRERAPQATPLLLDDRLITIGFTGKLHCLDLADGTPLWTIDLVQRFDAHPVQFGFSASPILVGDTVVVLSGGERGGLVGLNPATGETKWNLPCGEASYATPIVADFNGSQQIVFVTRNRIVGAEATTGRKLWQFELPKPGMTNVPTPLAVNDGLIVAGQGIGGTSRLRISRQSGAWQVSEVWTSTANFFHCNWTIRDRMLYGCNGNLLSVVDVESGKSLAKWRGYKDSNLLFLGDTLAVFDGAGNLTFLSRDETGFVATAKHGVTEGRCWTSPTFVGNDIVCRGETELVCADLSGDAVTGESFARQPIRRTQLKLKNLADTASVRPDSVIAELANQRKWAQEVDPVDAITEAYDEGGIEAATAAYRLIRASARERLTLKVRATLIELAIEEDLSEFATQLLTHVQEDHAGDQTAMELVRSLRTRVNPQPSRYTHLADNGLLYLEVGIRNSGRETYHTEVRGPAAHPFGYGIPFRPGKTRIEKWPVGTRLYSTMAGIKKKLLLEIKPENAGKTLDLVQDAGE